MLGWLVERLRLAPMVERMDKDIEGHHVTIRTSTRYTIVTFDGLELFFLRENGEYDGFGRMARS